MSGPIVRTGTTPEFWKNYDQAFGKKKSATKKKKAAKKNIAEASFHLARFYERGLIVKKNKAKSLELYEKAAISGIRAAQFNLGLLMATSKEYDRDRLISSWAWLSLALENGVLNSEKVLAKITKYLSPIEQDKGTRLLEQIRNLTNE